MHVLDKLLGQTLLEVVLEEGNTGLRFSNASLGVYAPIEGASLDELVGHSIIEVRHIESKHLELYFSGGQSIRVILVPDVQTGPEAYALRFDGGPIVVG